MVTCYIALGSNIEPREYYLKKAVQLLRREPDVVLVKWSGIVESQAQTREPQPDFLNAVIEIKTGLAPKALLKVLLDIETCCGRQRKGVHAPRTLDLDLLLYGREMMQMPALTIPHPRMHERAFVLGPLAEIAPKVLHPLNHRTIAALLANVSHQEVRPWPGGTAWAASLKE